MVSARPRVILVLLLAVGLWAILGVEMGRWDGGILRLPLPIAHGQGFPVPLVYWIGVVLYSQVYGVFFHLPRPQRWARALRLGFGLHALVLMAGLPGWSAAHRTELASLSVWYVRYWQAVWVLTVAVGGAWLWTVASAGWRSWTTDPLLCFVPLIGGYLALCLSASAMPRAITLLTVGLTVGIGAAWRLDVTRRWGARFIEWLGRERVWIVAVFLIALAFRLFYTARVMMDADFLNTGSDGATFDALAWALVQGQPTPESVPWWATHDHFFSPGYVRFVALIYGLVGRSYFAVCAVQAVMGATTCMLMYAVAKQLFGITVARLAAAFGVVSFPMIFAAAGIGHQAVDLFLTLAVIWCLLQYLERPEPWGRWLIGIGLLLGWAAVTREGNIVVWLFLLGWFLLGVRVRVGWRRAILHVAMLSLGFGLVVVPFLRGSGGGIHGRLGLQWFYHQHSSTPINSWFNPWRDPAGAWALVREQPVTVILRVGEAVVGNFNALFLNQDYGSFDPVFLVRGSPYYFGMWWYAYGLAFVGLGLLLRQAWRTPIECVGWWLIVGLLVSRTSVHLFFESAYRHRVPLEPYLIILGAFGLTQLLMVARGRVTVKVP